MEKSANIVPKSQLIIRLRKEQNVNVLGGEVAEDDDAEFPAFSTLTPTGPPRTLGGGPLDIFVEHGGSSASLSSVTSAL